MPWPAFTPFRPRMLNLTQLTNYLFQCRGRHSLPSNARCVTTRTMPTASSSNAVPGIHSLPTCFTGDLFDPAVPFQCRGRHSLPSNQFGALTYRTCLKRFQCRAQHSFPFDVTIEYRAENTAATYQCRARHSLPSDRTATSTRSPTITPFQCRARHSLPSDGWLDRCRHLHGQVSMPCPAFIPFRPDARGEA